jgi:RNA polymerase sigma-70 factor, ECF subfamily
VNPRSGVADPFADADDLIRRVYAFAEYALGPGASADDVTSETFERAVRYRDSFDPRRGTPAAWIIGIARRCVADAARPAFDPADPVPARSSPDHAERVVRRLELRDAMSRLHARDRELLSLRYGADLSAQQIGGLLEMSSNAVAVALHRALARLRAILEEAQ